MDQNELKHDTDEHCNDEGYIIAIGVIIGVAVLIIIFLIYQYFTLRYMDDIFFMQIYLGFIALYP